MLVNEDVPGSKRLIAYIVYPDASQYVLNDLRGQLRQRLPEYMMPADFVVLKSIPYNSNGKVDRHQLSEMRDTHLTGGETYVAPVTVVEQSIATIWQDVLHVERVGLQDNFFDLGGHSLVAIRLMSQVRVVFQCDLPLRAIFEAPILQAFVDYVEQITQN